MPRDVRGWVSASKSSSPRARTYYEAQHWDEAALGFREIAIEHSDHDAGIHAAQLYLESLYALAKASH